jgi:deoxyribodipyrimidine photo-lyase
MTTRRAIHWFRNDLRLGDNPALCAAAECDAVIPIWIEDAALVSGETPGAAFRWWERRSLAALDRQLAGTLRLYRGDPRELLPRLVARYKADRVTWTRAYEPWSIARDRAIEKELEALGVEVVSANGSLLWEPWQITKSDGTPYRVFTPFYTKGCLEAPPPRRPIPAPALQLLPPDADEPLFRHHTVHEASWEAKLGRHWRIGEAAAQARLAEFLAEGLPGYAKGRDYPALPHVSRLSPHLAHGEISPNTLWYAVEDAAPRTDVAKFRAELAWREFAHHLLFHFPTLVTQPFRAEFAAFPWRDDIEALRAWQRGETGIPIVDAGMRELWETGYMHNRVRMIVASFLTKNLLVDWRRGEAWFRDCLVDAAVAVNVASWQWVAGCGADAAPYFRIFNPVLQTHKFDPEGAYLRQWLPELKDLPPAVRAAPWHASETVLARAGVVLGKDYPRPIVDLDASRQAALAAFARIASPDRR